MPHRAEHPSGQYGQAAGFTLQAGSPEGPLHQGQSSQPSQSQNQASPPLPVATPFAQQDHLGVLDYVIDCLNFMNV